MDVLVTSYAIKLFGARWLTFRKMAVPEKTFFNGKNFKIDILVSKYVLNNSKSILIKKNRKIFDFLGQYWQKIDFF